MIKRTFTFEGEDTCKQEWVFALEDGPCGLVIRDLVVTDREESRGCSGHPDTIVALVRDRLVSSLDIDALTMAACGRDLACGQALARCLRELESE